MVKINTLQTLNEKNLKRENTINVLNNKKTAIIYDHYIIDDVVYFALFGKIESTFAFVSLNRWDIVKKYKWYLGKAGYPMCYELGKMQLHKFVYRYILQDTLPTGLYVDHIDRNKLNNSNGNLRLATPQENSFNKTSKSNTKGVKKISKNNYSVCVYKDKIKHEIKNIPTEKQAAELYNIMAEELFGEFAAPNII